MSPSAAPARIAPAAGARVRHVTAAGFGLVELVVAAALLSVGLLTLCGTAAFAAAKLREASLAHEATRHAATLLDSLRAVPEPASGSRDRPPLRATWTVSASHIDLVIEFAADGRARARTYHAARHTFAPLPTILGGPPNQ